MLQVFDFADLIITKVHSVSFIYTPANTRLRRTDRRRWAVVLKYEGETIYTFEGKQLLSDASHAVFLPRGCSYEWACTRAGHYAILEFECAGTCAEPFGVPVKNSEHILKLLRELEYRRSQKKPLTEPESIRDAYSLILHLLQPENAGYRPTKKQEQLAPVLGYIAQNYTKPLRNDDLAALTGLSTVYFRKLFTQVTGCSPMVYARQLRMEKAKEMLRSDYGTLTGLALSLGYSSLYDFSRDFKKHTGVAPSHY